MLVAWSGVIVLVTLGGEPPRVRASWPKIWGTVSMKAIVGPATNLSVARFMGSLTNGWESEVIQRATGPLIPWGTTHCERGREMVHGKPPTNI